MRRFSHGRRARSSILRPTLVGQIVLINKCKLHLQCEVRAERCSRTKLSCQRRPDGHPFPRLLGYLHLESPRY